MITFIILSIGLLALLIVTAVISIIAGSAFLVVFADLIVFVLIIWGIYKAFTMIKK